MNTYDDERRTRLGEHNTRDAEGDYREGEMPDSMRPRSLEDEYASDTSRDRDLESRDFVHNEADDAADGATAEEKRASLFAREESQHLQARWLEIQTSFVDAPRDAVHHADRLVQETIDRLTETFSQTRGQLEHQWAQGENVSTEDLRVALQRYRSFFDRLLSL